MSQTPAGQSLFTVSGSITFGSASCTLQRSNDDMDSSMMWVDYTGKVEVTNNQDVTSSNWMTLPRDSNPSSATTTAGLSPKPSGVTSSHYKPVPFPGVGLVVWFGYSEMRFLGPDSTEYSISYPSSISSSCRPPSSHTHNTVIMITDGISSVTMGRRSNSTISCLVNVAFDWSASTYDATMLTVTPNTYPNWHNVYNWHNTAQDANGGDLLWTVNGKPAWVRARATLERAQLCLSHASMPSRPKAGPALTLRACVRSAVLERQYAPGHGHDRQRVPAELQ